MDDATKQALFTQLGEMNAKLDGLKDDNTKQWDKMEKMDTRLRGQEVRSAGISATVAGFLAIGIDAIKKTIGG